MMVFMSSVMGARPPQSRETLLAYRRFLQTLVWVVVLLRPPSVESRIPDADRMVLRTCVTQDPAEADLEVRVVPANVEADICAWKATCGRGVDLVVLLKAEADHTLRWSHHPQRCR